jgi:hypothetical protein
MDFISHFLMWKRKRQSFEGSLSRSSPYNRYQGIVYTEEDSPDSLGIFDSPDDEDWQVNSEYHAGLIGGFANPSSGVSFKAVCRFIIPQRDSILLTFNKTKRSVIQTIIANENFDEGVYDVDIVDSSLRSGMYRVYCHIYQNGIELISHGDLIFNRF